MREASDKKNKSGKFNEYSSIRVIGLKYIMSL